MKKTFLFLAALAMSVSLSAEKITTLAGITSGNKYYVGATTGGNDFYFYVDGSAKTESIKGVAKEDVADAVALTFTAVTDGWTIQFDNGLYLGIKNAKDNGAVQVMETSVVWTIEEDANNSLLKLHPNDYYLQKNNSGTQFGSYKATQTNVWLESAGAAPVLATLDSLVIKGKAEKMEYEVGEAFDPAGLEVWGIYTKTVKHDSTSQITSGITWTIDPETFEEASDNASVTLVASYKDLTTADTTITGINVKAAVVKMDVAFDFTTNLYGHTGVSSGSGDNYVSDGDIAVGEKFNEDPAQIEFTVNGGTQTRFWDASKKHELRLYKGATFVLSIVGDYKIIKVEFTGSAVNLESNGVTVSDKVWEGDATKSVTFVNTATGSKINSIKVTYIAAAPAVANPTITADTVANVYWKPITVTLACETEGADIYYTLDGSEPTALATKYDAPFSVSATTTVKAIAIKSGLDNSEVVSKTFTFGTVFASLEELVANQPATDDVAYVQVTITNAEIDSFYVSSKGYTNGIFVTANGTAVELYTNDVPETWEAGGKVSGTIKAEWLLYKGTPELQKWDGAWEAFTYSAEAAPAAPALNIYASGLKLNDGKISYLLNAPASALQMIIKNGENIVKTIDITDAAALTMGQHNDIAVDLSDITAAGTYTWALKASAPATDSLTLVSDESNRFNFYTPTGMAVDNSMESPFFGRIYVVESREGLATGAGRTTHEGLYIYSADLADVTNQGDAAYNGSVTWAEATDGSDASGNTYKMFGPGRIAVDEAGYVFICDNMRVSGKPITTGLWMMDPANPSANFVEVLDHNKIGTTYNRVNAVAVSGTGADRVVYTIDWSDSIVSYPVGECATPYAGGMTGVVPALASYNIVNAMSSLARGPQGDFWVFQYRGQLDTYPIVSHFNVNGERDFYISSDNNADLAAQSSANIRGNGALSPDGKKIAWAGNKVLSIYDVTYDEFGVPSLSNLQTIATGKNIDAMAFDAAGNIYYASASTEYFFAYAMPKADNSFVTAAPAAQNFVIAAPSLADILDGKTIRRAVACDDAVYVLAIDAQKAPTLVKADFEGNIITEYATDFCTVQGTDAACMILGDIALTADGILVGINAEYTTTTAVRGSDRNTMFYKWAADGTGEVWIDGATLRIPGSDSNPTSCAYGNGMAESFAVNGTLDDCMIAMRVRCISGPNLDKCRMSLLKIANGEITNITYNQALSIFDVTTNPVTTVVAAPAANDFILIREGAVPAEWTPNFDNITGASLVASMDAAYEGISGFSFAKGGDAIDWMIIPAADGAKILNVTSGLATATVVETLTAEDITCDFMFAALVGEAGAKKVMLMRDADIELLDIAEQPVYTNLNEIKAAAKAVKVMRNGHVFIIRDGKMFNMQGMIVK